MKLRLRVVSLIGCAALSAHAPAHASPPSPSYSCADAGVTFEQATAGTTEYWFSSPGHVLAAEGVSWLGIMHRALLLLGTEQGCWTGGIADGPYDDTSVYECDDIHCPIGGCPTPCLAYHSTECVAPQAAGGQVIEGLECGHYGDGISRNVESGDLVILRAHLHDLNDDAIEDDFGLSNTRVFDSLIDGVHIAFGDRQRSSADNDATAKEWEVRDSLIRARPNQNPYNRRPGHSAFWKGDRDPVHQHRYRITDNVFVAQGLKQGGLLFPVVGYVDECAGNTLLWAGPIAGDGGWEEALADQNDFADGLTDGERLTALNAAFPDCFHVVLKAEEQPEAEFLDTPLPELGGKSWNQLVAAWVSRKSAPGVAITAPAEGATVVAGDAIGFAASANDTEDGDLSAAILWSSSLAGPLGFGADLTLTDLWVGTHVVTASVVDAGGLAGSATVTVTVEAANTAPGVSITAPADGATVVAGEAVGFSASASDGEEGDLSTAIAWTSDLAGPLGSGASLTLTDLAVGAHVVTASVTDAGGLAGSATVTLTVEAANTAPGISITAPADGSTVVAGEAVGFSASASDGEEGDLSTAIVWTSDLAGPLGSGASLTLTDLAVGTHVVTASVTDAGGLAGSAAVTVVVVEPANTPPGVTMLSPANGTTVSAGTALVFSASADDPEDGDLSAAIAWSSSLSGPLGSGASLTLTSLSRGTHVVTAAVIDAGALVASATVTVTVTSPSPAPACGVGPELVALMPLLRALRRRRREDAPARSR